MINAAKNMDSLFADCTDDELMFDVIFDDDETIIDCLAGVNEAGNLVTESFILEGDDMVGENPDFEYNNDGDASYSEKDAEGTKDEKLEVGAEVGDCKEVSGEETKSAEAHAHDEPVKEDAAEGPIEDDDVAEREGETSDAAIATEASLLDEALKLLGFDEACESTEEEEVGDPGDESLDEEVEVETEACKESEEEEVGDPGDESDEALEEALAMLEDCDKVEVDPLTDGKCPVDTDVRNGDTSTVDTKNVEGVDTDPVEKSLDEALAMLEDCDKVEVDPLTDGKCPNDSDVRSGDTSTVDTKNVEGVDTDTVEKSLDEALAMFEDADTLDVDDNDEDDIAAIDSGELDPEDIKEAAADVIDQDDKDIEDVEKDAVDGTADVDVEYDDDDDELINAVMNNLIDKLE